MRSLKDVVILQTTYLFEIKVYMASRTKGFTLIELTIVIVILAIISAVAVPKFINLSGDAKKAKIASVAAELRIAIDLIYYKSLILHLLYEEFHIEY